MSKETKRAEHKNLVHLTCLSGQVKAAEDGVYIEGFANKNIVDRSKEIIEPKAWKLDDYKKNPVILYNHGMDAKLGGTPIGKCIKIEPRDEGLFIKVKMSSVDDPDLNRIRGLVKEGMLRAFSVGSDPKESDVDADGVRVIKQADLYEVSVVGVPMNQDSLFSISGKMMATKSIDQIGATVCEKKGALVAANIHKRIYQANNPITYQYLAASLGALLPIILVLILSFGIISFAHYPEWFSGLLLYIFLDFQPLKKSLNKIPPLLMHNQKSTGRDILKPWLRRQTHTLSSLGIIKASIETSCCS